MNQLDAFRALPERLSPGEKREIQRIFVANTEQGELRVMELAAAHGLDLSAADVADLIADSERKCCLTTAIITCCLEHSEVI